jgi:hypothetical protein
MEGCKHFFSLGLNINIRIFNIDIGTNIWKKRKEKKRKVIMCESKGVEDHVRKGDKGYKELNHVP